VVRQTPLMSVPDANFGEDPVSASGLMSVVIVAGCCVI
jgi:hypothetical protein